jgi:hypothetical protein
MLIERIIEKIFSDITDPRYYISSLPPKAQLLASSIRQHWEGGSATLGIGCCLPGR